MQHWGIDLDRKDRYLLDYEARNKILSGVLAWNLTASLATALILAWSLLCCWQRRVTSVAAGCASGSGRLTSCTRWIIAKMPVPEHAKFTE